MPNMRRVFKDLYREARVINRETANELTAYAVNERAMDQIIHETGCDYEPVLDAGRAVLWAIHWRFKEPVNRPPLGMSERHLGFHAGPDGCETWFERSPLPC